MKSATIKILTLLAFLLVIGNGFAQTPDKTKAKTANDPIAGYKKRKIEGFTVLLNDKVLDADVSKYERKPIDVLELELKTIVTIMSPRAVKALQNVVIWVEWEDIDKKNPLAVAKYYGGSSLWVLDQGKNPLKANNIEVLTMRRLTEVHQPKSKFQQCVLLHEMAHAVHHQLFTWDDPLIKSAYKQAMERKLYDSVKNIVGKIGKAYAATSANEYFAELSCAYLDKGTYFPFTRDELKTHDPTGFKLMETVWSKAESKQHKTEKDKADKSKTAVAAKEASAKTKSTEPSTPEDDAARKLKLTQAAFEDGHVEGPEQDRYKKSLEKLITAFPNTAAAKQAKDLIEKMGK
jgi:hypothetical protein